MKRRVTGILTAFLLISCGDDQASTVSSNAPEAEPVMLIASGGNTSCGSDANDRPTPYGMWMYDNVETLLADLAGNHIETRYIISCHTESATVYYATSDDSQTIYEESIADFHVTLDSFVQRETSKVYMAGHSYGGWLTMKAVLNTNFRYNGVFTLDAISRETCTFSSPFGCMSAPSDIGTEDREFIAENSDHWHNFYQTRTFYLHSSSISQADANTNLEVTHYDVDTDARVWNAVREAIDPALAVNM